MAKQKGFGERKSLARNLWGRSTVLPQQTSRRILLHRRKLNFDEAPIGTPSSASDVIGNLELDLTHLIPINANPDQIPGPTFVDNVNSFTEMMEMLSTEKFVTLDLEGNVEHSFLGMISLIQIGSVKGRFLVDPFPLFAKITTDLKSFLEDPKKLIIMHGCANDILWLRRDFEISLVNVIDTQLIYQDIHRGNLIGYGNLVQAMVPSLYLSDIQKDVCQLADWTKRPLHADLVKYADNDIFGLLFIWEKFKMQDKDGFHILSAFRKTKALLLKTYTKPMLSYKKETESMRKLIKLSAAEEEKARILWEFRNFHAKSVDINPSELLNIKLVLEIAKKKPTTAEQLGKIVLSSNVVLTKSYGTILKLLQEGKPFLQKIQAITCNNCLRVGHAAFSCWEKYSSSNVIRFYKLHPELKTLRNKGKHAREKRVKKEKLAQSK